MSNYLENIVYFLEHQRVAYSLLGPDSTEDIRMRIWQVMPYL